VLLDVEQFADDGVFIVAVFQVFARTRLFDAAKNLNDEHAVMRHDGSPAFTDDVRVGDVFGVANVGYVKNDVVLVFLQRVIGGGIESATRAVVIHAQTAANVEELDV